MIARQDMSMDRVEPRYKGLPTSMDKVMEIVERIEEQGGHKQTCHPCRRHHLQVGGVPVHLHLHRQQQEPQHQEGDPLEWWQHHYGKEKACLECRLLREAKEHL